MGGFLSHEGGGGQRRFDMCHKKVFFFIEDTPYCLSAGGIVLSLNIPGHVPRSVCTSVWHLPETGDITQEGLARAPWPPWPGYTDMALLALMYLLHTIKFGWMRRHEELSIKPKHTTNPSVQYFQFLRFDVLLRHQACFSLSLDSSSSNVWSDEGMRQLRHYPATDMVSDMARRQ